MIINTSKLLAPGDVISLGSSRKIVAKVYKICPPTITAILYYDNPYTRQFIYLNYQKHNNIKFVKKNKLC